MSKYTMRDISITALIHLFPMISQALGIWHCSAITRIDMTVQTNTRDPIARLNILCKVLGERDRSKTTTDILVQHNEAA